MAAWESPIHATRQQHDMQQHSDHALCSWVLSAQDGRLAWQVCHPSAACSISRMLRSSSDISLVIMHYVQVLCLPSIVAWPCDFVRREQVKAMHAARQLQIALQQ
jgi:hypothetical protein